MLFSSSLDCASFHLLHQYNLLNNGGDVLGTIVSVLA